MMSRRSNWTDATGLLPMERELIIEALKIAERFERQHGRLPTVQEVERIMTGQKGVAV
jgi:hypothetical protein